MRKSTLPGERPSPSEEPGRDETVPAPAPQGQPKQVRKSGGANPPPEDPDENTNGDAAAPRA